MSHLSCKGNSQSSSSVVRSVGKGLGLILVCLGGFSRGKAGAKVGIFRTKSSALGKHSPATPTRSPTLRLSAPHETGGAGVMGL